MFHRKLLVSREDFIKVLDTLTEKGNWGKPLPVGTGHGIAIHECYGSIVGAVAEAAVKQVQVKVDRVVVAFDSGHAVNPLTVTEQLEGGVIWGPSAALFGRNRLPIMTLSARPAAFLRF